MLVQRVEFHQRPCQVVPPLLLQYTDFSKDTSLKYISTHHSRLFRIMDDDGSKSLDLAEFKKGLHDYGLTISDKVGCERHANLNRRQKLSKMSCIFDNMQLPSDLCTSFC